MWNSELVTLRYLGNFIKNNTIHGDQQLTNNSVVWQGAYFSRSLPGYLSFPMFGTRDINTADANFLYLPRRTAVYMLRKDGWRPVDLDGWTFTGDEGLFLGPQVGRVKIYKREYDPGRYTIDNNSALYLFDVLGTFRYH